MDSGTIGVVITISAQLIGIGIFVGITKTQNANTTARLQRIEDKQDKQNSEMVEIRERIAVVESVLEIKKGR